MNGFGECPRCGKIGLVIVQIEEEERPMIGWEHRVIKYIHSIEVKCIYCGYSKTIYL